ncbi:hypothetical protein KNP414_06424 [Paenibacillus mucilaginosus KNP414]|uniref:Uncharacterized protein n=1 Tax=Paenibacillus mucilaginosus (strain KNP414) TaxID=1036673 RepID=F8FMY5_PAEMK|nr:hypothetical protein KNP414_06424 [Paenibacillus mucilaginosus KNP414]
MNLQCGNLLRFAEVHQAGSLRYVWRRPAPAWRQAAALCRLGCPRGTNKQMTLQFMQQPRHMTIPPRKNPRRHAGQPHRRLPGGRLGRRAAPRHALHSPALPDPLFHVQNVFLRRNRTPKKTPNRSGVFLYSLSFSPFPFPLF